MTLLKLLLLPMPILQTQAFRGMQEAKENLDEMSKLKSDNYQPSYSIPKEIKDKIKQLNIK